LIVVFGASKDAKMRGDLQNKADRIMLGERERWQEVVLLEMVVEVVLEVVQDVESFSSRSPSCCAKT
jgi:hypothetical protein